MDIKSIGSFWEQTEEKSVKWTKKKKILAIPHVLSDLSSKPAGVLHISNREAERHSGTVKEEK